MVRDIVDHHSTRADYRPVPNDPARNCARANPYEYAFSELSATGEVNPGGNVTKAADAAIMIDCCAGINDDVVADNRIGVDDRMRQDHSAYAELHRRSDGGTGVDRTAPHPGCTLAQPHDNRAPHGIVANPHHQTTRRVLLKVINLAKNRQP